MHHKKTVNSDKIVVEKNSSKFDIVVWVFLVLDIVFVIISFATPYWEKDNNWIKGVWEKFSNINGYYVKYSGSQIMSLNLLLVQAFSSIGVILLLVVLGLKILSVLLDEFNKIRILCIGMIAVVALEIFNLKNFNDMNSNFTIDQILSTPNRKDLINILTCDNFKSIEKNTLVNKLTLLRSAFKNHIHCDNKNNMNDKISKILIGQRNETIDSHQNYHIYNEEIKFKHNKNCDRVQSLHYLDLATCKVKLKRKKPTFSVESILKCNFSRNDKNLHLTPCNHFDLYSQHKLNLIMNNSIHLNSQFNFPANITNSNNLNSENKNYINFDNATLQANSINCNFNSSKYCNV
ncbi:hypothetical protein A3Q56_06089 [Intoshia linei]|uniref:Uncharacterized protein n=1 Tax=Intoshia linei TaxID=1819745 RepID=A0A177AW00_9BILA|nr:hypothetical protein A3Q56_06089 [Intoshia linei]